MIIGSTALNRILEEEIRPPGDFDVLSPTPVQMPRVDGFWDDRLFEYDGHWDNPYHVATLDEQYTLKVSHAYWELPNGSWHKHMYDTVLLKLWGATLIPEFHDILYKIWEEKHGPKKMKFMGKDDFFEDAVVRIYDHDSLHDSVAYGDEAMYIQTLKREGHTAVDMNYIKGMPFEDQVKLFREEVCATALERIMVPSGYRGSAGAAYLWALRRTITSLTRGWSATFIVDNYSHFSKPCNYVERHLKNKERLVKL